MKPDEEMRADMEEQDLEPCDLFVDLGMLVVEGRIPGLTSRGYGEGPHCPPKSGGQFKHNCDFQDAQCIREENFRKHMLLLWRNSIPMSIEVLLCPECCHGNGKQHGIESLALPEPTYILLEQWTMQMLTKKVPDAAITGKNLLQVVRSFLHFSQLSAWYSLSGGKSPQNVVYRICVPGEAFSNKFLGPPDVHAFPIANVGRNNAMKVSVRSLPRSPEIPIVTCRIHERVIASAKESEANKLSMACALTPEEGVNRKDEGNFLTYPSNRRDSSPETLLGESLLDPPQSLQMYPKRYQSPSRSGSPVMETPEHLMFGTCREMHETKYPKHCDTRTDRSRQRRSIGVKSYFRSQNLDKNVSDTTMVHLKEKLVPSVQSPLSEPNRPPNSGNNNSFYFALTPKETEEILNVLRQRSTCRTNRNYFKMNDKPEHLQCASVHGEYSMVWRTEGIKAAEYSVSSQQVASEKTLPQTVLREQNEWHKKECFPSECSRFTNSLDYYMPSKCHMLEERMTFNYLHSNAVVRRTQDAFLEKIKTETNSSAYNRIRQNKTKVVSILNTAIIPAKDASTVDSNGFQQEKVSNGNVSYKVSKNQEVCDNTPNLKNLMKTKHVNDVQSCNNLNNPRLNLLKEVLDRQLRTENCLDADGKIASKIIPSAIDKANFRRSLDSATSMVFHSKTGLPLTSSPAPLRKGTCFDFDSSLTSITAIKKYTDANWTSKL